MPRQRSFQELQDLFKRLITATQELNESRSDYRRAVSKLAGCDLTEEDGWTFKDLMKYQALAKAWVEKRNNQDDGT